MNASGHLAPLALRANVYKKIRQFFEDRHVMEVETPLLHQVPAPDPALHSLKVTNNRHQIGFLQTSPETHMKRLLAAGSGDIYQMGKVFRDDEWGKRHTPEFTLLEWYRVGFDHHALMDEVDVFLQATISALPAEKITYQNLFLKMCDWDPFEVTLEGLVKLAKNYQLTEGLNTKDMTRDDWLHLLLSHVMEPHLGFERPLFVYDFPPSQAALAKIREDAPPVAERFEVYVKGMELANGFHELTDSNLQRKRFEKEMAMRQAQNLPYFPLDEQFLKALEKGMPAASGVALGIDRLLMLAANLDNIEAILSFSGEWFYTQDK